MRLHVESSDSCNGGATTILKRSLTLDSSVSSETYINTFTAVVGKGWAKGKSAIPVRGPSVGGRDWRRQDRVGQGGEGGGRRSRMGDGVGRTRQRVWDGAPGTQDVKGDFGIGEETVPEVVGKVRVGGREDRDEMVFACSYCPLCRVGSLGLWGHKRHRQPLREKVLSAL